MGNQAFSSGGEGGGGGGFLLGPATNSFGDVADPIADARDDRDDYANANANWLSIYDDDDDLHIRLLSTAGATFEQRIALAWVVVAGALQGDEGTPGTPGEDGTVTEVRFRISADNTAPAVTSTAAGWSTTSVDMDAANTYLWRIFRVGLPGALPNWNTITPQLIGRWGVDGTDGDDGDDGEDGDHGTAGQYVIYVYQNTAARPGGPTGGSHDVASGVTTPPTGWTVEPETPAAGDNTWFVQDIVHPATQSGVITPTWSVVLEAGGTGPPGEDGTDGVDGDGVTISVVSAYPALADADPNRYYALGTTVAEESTVVYKADIGETTEGNFYAGYAGAGFRGYATISARGPGTRDSYRPDGRLSAIPDGLKALMSFELNSARSRLFVDVATDSAANSLSESTSVRVSLTLGTDTTHYTLDNVDETVPDRHGTTLANTRRFWANFDHEVGHTFLLEHNVKYVASFRLSGEAADLELHTGENLEEVIDRALLDEERGELDRSLADLEEHVEGNTDAIDALNNREQHASHVYRDLRGL